MVTKRCLVVVALASALIAGTVVAGISDASSKPTVFFACRAMTGSVSSITTNSGLKCYSGKKVVTWNAVGPQGVRGVAGPTGARGPQGPVGNTGPAGPRLSLAQIATFSWGRTTAVGANLSGGSYGFTYPYGVAFDGTHMWVVNSNAYSVTEFNADDGSWIRTVSGGSYGFNVPQAIAFDGQHLWVTNTNGNSVTELNASDGSWVRTILGGNYGFDNPEPIAFDGSHLWIGNFRFGGSSLTEVNASDGSWVRTLSGGSYGFSDPFGIAFDGAHLWVSNYAGNSV